VLLEHTMMSVLTAAPAEAVRLKVWVDLPKSRPERREPVLQMLRLMPAWYPVRDTELLVYERHMGTRGMWLSALSLPPPMLMLEDDVVLLPGAYEYYLWSLVAMARWPSILGTSFQVQTTVNLLGSPGSLKSDVPYTYPLVGSHGFMISPTAHRRFFHNLHTRDEATLFVQGLQTTAWYTELKKQGVIDERMWTQEMVAFAHHRNMTTLYPPTSWPFAVHCATDHGSKEVQKNPDCWNLRHRAIRPVKDIASWDEVHLPELTSGAICVRNCHSMLNASR
jgi:hypothetical protein